MLTTFDGFFWVVAAMVALLFLQRFLHREIQAVFLIATRNPGITMLGFSLIFLPGVFLHELSHLVTAKLLGVRTGKFSLLPDVLPDGRLQLGYVEAAYTDIFRDSLVGLAPLISGLVFVAAVAVNRLHLVIMWDTFRNAQWELFWMGLRTLPALPDFWVWFYLTFAVSSTMMPSASDRHAWMPLGVVSVLMFAFVLLAGAGPWMLANLAPALNSFLRGTALILLVSILVHGLLILPLLLIHRLLTRLTGLDIG
jgi:hypothetical protein